MVIVNISYGLGNQMCQYAAARALALRTKSSLILDASYFKNNKKYRHEIYGLDFFELPKPKIKNPKFSYYLKGIIIKLKLSRIALYITDTESPAIISCKSKIIYLDGIFLSEKYFTDCAAIIRTDFTFKNIDEKNLQLGKQLAEYTSISVHIRRGEFVIKEQYGTSPLEYYQKAIDYLTSKFPDSHWYFFSDDINWVRENLPKPENTNYISHNTGADSYKDMYLMSQCKHNIIANSSFSWWGAWLNANPGKIVIAPVDWLAKQGIKSKTLVPENWLLF